MNFFRRKQREVVNPQSEPTEDRSYTDIITRALVDAAADSQVSGYVAALEIASGQLSRAFAAATVTGRDAEFFDPWVMSQIGRSFIESGESVWFRVGRRFIRGDNYTLRGTEYEINLATGAVRLPEASVFHARWNIDVNTLRGIGPLATARTLRSMMERLEGSLNDEVNASVGHLLPIPAGGNDKTVEGLKADIANLKGKIAVIETASGGWDRGAGSAPRREYELDRLGPNVPNANVELFETARNTVLTACGYPVSLMTDRDGTAQRESWRRYLHGTVAPLGHLVIIAARRAGLTIEIEWDALFASDIQGRARAFASMVSGGMALDAAAAASGILSMD